MFGVAIEVTVQRQESTRPIPFILIKCADYLILTGKNKFQPIVSALLFKLIPLDTVLINAIFLLLRT